MKKNKKVILLVVGIILFLVVTALAIDGARLFSEKRKLQGITNTAAFTAAAYIGQFDFQYIHNNWTTGVDIKHLAEQAALGLFPHTDRDPYYRGAYDRLRITIDPVNPNTEFTAYITKVKMISEVDPIFAQLVYHKPILVIASSEAVIWPRMNAGYSRTLFSTAPDGARRIELTGNSDIFVYNSGIFASSIDPQAIYISDRNATTITGAVTSVGGVNYSSGLLSLDPGYNVQEYAQPMPIVPIPAPEDCSALSTSVEIFDPGTGITWHSAGRIITPTNISSGYHIFASGWYCITEDFQISGGIVESEAAGLMFFFPEGDTSFTISAGLIDLRAAQNGAANDIAGIVWDGILIYMAQGNTGSISISPDPGSYLEGTIYAPGPPQNELSPKCSIDGSGVADTIKVQFICYPLP
jgi:hypothetical protein